MYVNSINTHSREILNLFIFTIEGQIEGIIFVVMQCSTVPFPIQPHYCCSQRLRFYKLREFPLWLSELLVPMRTPVQSMALLSGLWIRHCCKWHKLTAAAAILPLAWKHPYAVGVVLKKKKKKKKINTWVLTFDIRYVYKYKVNCLWKSRSEWLLVCHPHGENPSLRGPCVPPPPPFTFHPLPRGHTCPPLLSPAAPERTSVTVHSSMGFNGRVVKATFWRLTAWDQNVTLPLPVCVTLGKSLNLSVLYLPPI